MQEPGGKGLVVEEFVYFLGLIAMLLYLLVSSVEGYLAERRAVSRKERELLDFLARRR